VQGAHARVVRPASDLASFASFDVRSRSPPPALFSPPRSSRFPRARPPRALPHPPPFLPHSPPPIFSSRSQNSKFVVLATLKRAASELSASQRKLFKIDSNVGVAVSGLTADGAAATKRLRADCISHRFTFESEPDVQRLAGRVADKAQIATQRSGARPSGVGMLIAGVDETGAHLIQTCPSGNAYDHVAAAIGARSQASRTFLEKHLDQLEGLGADELIALALRALKEAASDPLTEKTCGAAIVGEGTPFTIVEGEALEKALEAVEGE
jgi:20S proteasome subunit alpha 6